MSDIYHLIWDTWNREHIAKHNLQPREVEEAYQTATINKQLREPRRIVLGRSKSGRYITIIVAPASTINHYYVITARDMSRKERKYYDSHQAH